MRALVTGATGFIGFHVARLLGDRGVRVAALVREESDVSALEALHVELCRGDVRDFESVCKALKGCSHLYHLAADYRLWVPDPWNMYQVNVQGTINIMKAAMKMGVERVVYTSTVGALAAGRNSRPSNEDTPVSIKEMIGHYKRSKFIAEKEVCKYLEQGAPVVIVNPSTPVGPMDRKPTPTGKMIVDFLNGMIPAYLDTGLNFVDVEDVAAGHWHAALHGRIGQKYILGNRNMTLREFFEVIAAITGRKPPKVRLPYLPVLCAAYINETLSKWITNKHPRIPLTGVRMARKYMYFDCSKAVRELNMPRSSIEGALERAIKWFEENGYIGRMRCSGRAKITL
ncbi:MAG: NAD-dependent epimerase/dehydratase family protein [Nitrospirae bacterium]|nr:NAD-dependent epimerase/dehydratase family protein [Nitrospirota bacterium]MCL5237988.1 NAD-dependent epimerase/dehydratase family protein [Nitrospirota bacterium]